MTIDSNKTSHLHIFVRKLCRSKGAIPVDLLDIRLSVVDDDLAAEANTTHGSFASRYQVPEFVFSLSTDKVLHVACPALTQQSQPRLIDIVIEADDEPETKTDVSLDSSVI